MAALKREMSARAKSERELKESEERMRQMQEAMENHQRELQEARDTIARLEAQLRETQVRIKTIHTFINVFINYSNDISISPSLISKLDSRRHVKKWKDNKKN